MMQLHRHERQRTKERNEMFFHSRRRPAQILEFFTLQKGEVMAGKLFKRWPSH